VELGFLWAGVLDRVGADFHPFWCVGSTWMYGTNGPVRNNPWEGRY
jgi:hypothetical protein